MWSKSISRREFAELLQSRKLPSSDGLQEFSANQGFLYSRLLDEIELVWNYDPRRSKSLPAVVIVPSDKELDLLAWVASYVPSMRPLTAYCHVVEKQIANLFWDLPVPSLNDLDNVCVSLVLCELATFVGNKREALQSSPTACQATLSFSIARAAALGLPQEVTSELPGKWAQARSLLGTAVSPKQTSALVRVWSVVAALARANGSYEKRHFFPELESPPAIIVETCRDLLRHGEFDLRNWREPLFDLPDTYALNAALKGPREERVILLETALRHAEAAPPTDKEMAGFLLAYLASAVSPGTLDHIQLILPFVRSFPDILLWYGLLAGISSKGSLGKIADGLARRVLRELERDNDFLSAPSCDIALPELSMLTASSRDWRDIRTNIPGNLSVELFPCINSVHRFSRGNEVFDTNSSQIVSSVQEADYLLRQLNRTMDRLRTDVGIEAPPLENSQRPRRRGRT